MTGSRYPPYRDAVSPSGPGRAAFIFVLAHHMFGKTCDPATDEIELERPPPFDVEQVASRSVETEGDCERRGSGPVQLSENLRRVFPGNRNPFDGRPDRVDQGLAVRRVGHRSRGQKPSTALTDRVAPKSSEPGRAMSRIRRPPLLDASARS